MLTDVLTLKFLKGKRTYIIAFGALAGVLVQYATGAADFATSVQHALEALGLATLRASL